MTSETADTSELIGQKFLVCLHYSVKDYWQALVKISGNYNCSDIAVVIGDLIVNRVLVWRAGSQNSHATRVRIRQSLNGLRDIIRTTSLYILLLHRATSTSRSSHAHDLRQARRDRQRHEHRVR